jgi:RNA recognition motif-containing protein
VTGEEREFTRRPGPGSVGGANPAAQREDRAISRKLFVGNLPYHTTEDQLAQAFSSAGQVVSARIITDRETGRSRGFGFVEFSSEAEAEGALRAFQDFQLEGRKLRVNAAEERGPRGPRPPMGGGPGSFGGGAPFGRGFGKPKGSRRGLRARKRSLG